VDRLNGSHQVQGASNRELLHVVSEDAGLRRWLAGPGARLTSAIFPTMQALADERLGTPPAPRALLLDLRSAAPALVRTRCLEARELLGPTCTILALVSPAALAVAPAAIESGAADEVLFAPLKLRVLRARLALAAARRAGRPRDHAALLSAVEHAGVAIEITDREGRILYVNPAFTAITGYPLAEAVGQTPAALLRSERHGDGFFQDIWDTINRGEVFRGHMFGRRKDGSEYRQHTTLSPFLSPSGTIRGFVAIKRDVTEAWEAREAERSAYRALQDAQRQIAAQAETLRATIESASDAILVTDFDTARFHTVNAAAVEMFGYSRDEFTQRTGRQLSPPDAKALVDRMSEELRTIGRTVASRLPLTRRDGSIFYGDTRVVAFQVGERRQTVTTIRELGGDQSA